MKKRENQRGFALLLVFLMAAAVAIMLYQQMPRVAFESQRGKEQLLIDRGQQYVRGIQLYFVAYKKYPSKIEDLENTNNHRYLRHRYIDPMTGKDEWRLIHVNGAGQLTDSLVQKPPTPAGTSGTPGTSSTSGTPGTSGTSGTSGTFSTFGTSTATTTTTSSNGTSSPTNGPPEVNPAVLRRPSDSPLTPSNGLASTSTEPPDPNDPKYWPPIALVPANGQNGQPGQVPGQQYPGQQYPGQQYPGQQVPGQQIGSQQFPGQPINGGLPGGYQPGLPGQVPGQSQINPQNGFGTNGLPIPGQMPGQGTSTPGYVQPSQFQPQTGSGANPAANAAVGMIQTMLTTPRQPSTDSNFGSGTMGGTAIAGVATTFKGPSIKVYKDHQKYQEWEFIFDLKQGTPGQQPAQNGQQATQPGQSQQQPGQQQSTSGFSLSPSSFGPSTNQTTPPQPQQQQQQQQN